MPPTEGIASFQASVFRQKSRVQISDRNVALWNWISAQGSEKNQNDGSYPMDYKF